MQGQDDEFFFFSFFLLILYHQANIVGSLLYIFNIRIYFSLKGVHGPCTPLQPPANHPVYCLT